MKILNVLLAMAMLFGTAVAQEAGSNAAPSKMAKAEKKEAKKAKKSNKKAAKKAKKDGCEKGGTEGVKNCEYM